jgi:glucokinase
VTATVGLDLGGTKVLGVLASPDGEVLRTERCPTPPGEGELVALLAETARTLAEGDPAAVGVGAAGLVDLDGRVSYAPNIPALLDTPLRARLEEALPGVPAVVDNDANAAAWGEIVHGRVPGVANGLVVTLGTGIGGGIILDGKVFRGAHGFAAEIGHIQVMDDGPPCACGASGHWEAVASGSALGRLGREWAAAGRAPAILERAGGDAGAVTGYHVSDAALAGDADARRIVGEYADLVALGLASLANVLDPEVVVVGGGVANLGAVLFDPLRDSFDRRVEAAKWRPQVEIVPASLGEDAGAIGAAALARTLLS